MSDTLPLFDLSQDSSEVESLETTTTSVITSLLLAHSRYSKLHYNFDSFIHSPGGQQFVKQD